MAFVEGTSRDDLKKGPGHYPGHAAAGHDRQRRDRRPPHHLPAPVLGPRQAEARRRHHHPRRSSGRLRLPDDAAAHRAADRRLGRRQHARRGAHAHHVQPQGLGVAAHRDQGEARRRARARSPSIPKPATRRAPAESRAAAAGRARRRTLGSDAAASLPEHRLGHPRRARRARVVVVVPALAAPAHVVGRRARRSSSCCSRSTCTSNARCPPGTSARRERRPRAGRRAPRRASRRSCIARRCCVRASLDEWVGARGVRQGRAPAARRRVQVPRRDERGAVVVGRRRAPRCRRALVGQSRGRARARGRDARHPGVRGDAEGRVGGEARRGASATAPRSRCATTRSTRAARCWPR